MSAMSDREPPGDHPVGHDWFKAIAHRVDGLWDWMHSHDSEVGAFWAEQWKTNKRLETELSDHETRVRSLERLSAKVLVTAAIGASVGGALMSFILAKLAGSP